MIDKVKKVSFGDTTGLSIKRDDPQEESHLETRHNCDNPVQKNKIDIGLVINGKLEQK